MHQPFSFDDDLNIHFNTLNPDALLSTIWKVVKNYTKQPNIQYFAIYISPFNKLYAKGEDKRVYYRLKEMLLNYG